MVSDAIRSAAIAPASLLVAAVALWSCGQTRPRTQVMVIIEADPGVRARANHLEVRVAGRHSMDTVWPEPENRGFDPVGDATTLSFPIEVAVIPGGNDANRRFRLEAEAFEGGRGERVHRRPDGERLHRGADLVVPAAPPRHLRGRALRRRRRADVRRVRLL